MKIEDNKNPNSHEINYIVNLFKSGDFIKAEKEIKVLLDGGAEEIINTSVSADEARAKINMFLK